MRLRSNSSAIMSTPKACVPSPPRLKQFVISLNQPPSGAVFQQQLADPTRPLALISKELLPTETGYSTFGCELPTIYLAVKHFRHFLEGQDTAVSTDHEPLPFALRSLSDK
ncbi:hypothetical protein SprV_0301329100 [Sparganum proliferum]